MVLVEPKFQAISSTPHSEFFVLQPIASKFKLEILFVKYFL